MFGYVVTNLKRSRILNIKIGTLQPGEYRKIVGPELEELFQTIGLGK
jgi:16S rRNA U516 pseudouridylate synthase RsuA-like enzyme